MTANTPQKNFASATQYKSSEKIKCGMAAAEKIKSYSKDEFIKLIKKYYWKQQNSLNTISDILNLKVSTLKYYISKYDLNKKKNNINRKVRTSFAKHSFKTKAKIRAKFKSKQIVQICKNSNEVVKRWASISMAAKLMIVDKSSIRKCLKYSKYSAKGYKWYLLNDWILKCKKEFVNTSTLLNDFIDYTGNKVVNKLDLLNFYNNRLKIAWDGT